MSAGEGLALLTGAIAFLGGLAAGLTLGNSSRRIPTERTPDMLKGYKTYITGAMAVLGAIAAYLVGDMSLADALQIGVSALIGMTVRNAIG